MRITRRDGRRQVEFGPVIGTVVFLPLLFLAAGFSIPYGVVRRISRKRRALRFEARMAAVNRTMTLEEFIGRVDRGEGSYICEYKTPFKGPIRLWWTPDDIYSKTPFPCVDHMTML